MAEKKQYDIPLELTTPRMVGQRVKDAQWLLAGHNEIKVGGPLATYKDGAIDGDYGPLTAQATLRAKYWLGYSTKSVNNSFGQTLYELLNGTLKLSEDNLRVRKQRLTAVEMSAGAKALEQAITQIGTEESPHGSNRQKYGSWYGMNGVPWCAIFASWSFAQSGYKTFRYSYVPAVHSDATYCRNRLCVIRTPRPGDLACFSFGGSRDAHIEFFEKWINEGSTFYSVGGNTGASSFNNGGEVARNTRYVSTVDAFVRVL
jgi:CHAP domain